MTPRQWWTAEQIAAATGCPVENVERYWPLIASALDEFGIYDRANALGVIATVAIETASTFAPVREAFWLSEDWRRANLRYYPYYGRGFVQLTWPSNYRDAGLAVGADLLGNPDLALDPEIAARVLAWFWASHGVTSKDGTRWYSLPDLCREGDWEWVRRVVQGGTAGLDRLTSIIAELDAIKEAPVPERPKLRTTDGGVRLRDQPTTAGKILATLPAGTVVEAMDERAWRRVSYQGKEGWMAADYLEDAPAAPTPPRHANPIDVPVRTQDWDWDCAQEATARALKKLGRNPDNGWMERAMLEAGVESRDLGLMDSSGQQLAAWINQEYGDTIHAEAIPRLAFNDVPALLEQGALIAGGHHWGGGHWTGIDAATSGQVILGNPGGTGPIYGQQTLNEREWLARGPWSGVLLTRRA